MRKARTVGSRLRTAALGLVASSLACGVPQAPPRNGSPAPDLVATTLEGDTLSLTAFRGRPLLLNLWATWCAPCREETPYLQSLHERYVERGLRVVGVTVDTRGSVSEIRRFMEEFGVTYTVLHDPDMVSTDRYAVSGLPATFLVDRQGTIRHVVAGPVAAGDQAFAAALSRILE